MFSPVKETGQMRVTSHLQGPFPGDGALAEWGWGCPCRWWDGAAHHPPGPLAGVWLSVPGH